MGYCWLPLCNHKSQTRGCAMFRFPKSPRKRSMWKRVLRRFDSSPSKSARICACHFEGGVKSSVPTILPWNQKKMLMFKSPEKRQARNRVIRKLSFHSTATSPGQELASPGVESSCGQDFTSPSVLESASSQSQKSAGLPIPSSGSSLIQESTSSPVQASPIIQGSGTGSSPVEGGEPCSQSKSSWPCSYDPETMDSDPAFLALKSNMKEREMIEETARLRRDVETLQKQILDLQVESQGLRETIQKMEVDAKTNERVILKLREKIMQTSSIVFEAENVLLRKDIEELEKKLISVEDVFLFSKISHKNRLVEHFSGLPDKETFFYLLKLCSNFEVQYQKGWRVTRLDQENQLFLTLLKLRRGLTNLDLSLRFKIGKDSVANIFLSWLMLLHHVVVKNLMSSIPPREKIN